jgi:hypothetical protein
MRRPFLAVPIFALILYQYGTVYAQHSSLTANVVLPDEVMQQVVSRILRYEFKSGRMNRTIPVANVMIKAEWLPVIKNVQFNLVPEGDIINYEKGVFLIDRIEVDNGIYSINVGWGDLDCSGSGTTWKFRIGTDKVRLWPTTGWGRGCGNYGSDPPILRGLEIGEISPKRIAGV